MKSDFIKKDPEIGLIFTQKIVHDDPVTFHRENNFTNYSFIEDHFVKARFKVFFSLKFEMDFQTENFETYRSTFRQLWTNAWFWKM